MNDYEEGHTKTQSSEAFSTIHRRAFWSVSSVRDSSQFLAAKKPQEKTINDRTNVNKIEECDGGDTIE